MFCLCITLRTTILFNIKAITFENTFLDILLVSDSPTRFWLRLFCFRKTKLVYSSKVCMTFSDWIIYSLWPIIVHLTKLVTRTITQDTDLDQNYLLLVGAWWVFLLDFCLAKLTWEEVVCLLYWWYNTNSLPITSAFMMLPVKFGKFMSRILIIWLHYFV